MATHRLGLMMNGATGRMGTNRHLVRLICAMRAEGGVRLGNGDTVMPDPILVGRNEAKPAALADANGIACWTADPDAAVANPAASRVFMSATGWRRRQACCPAGA